MAYYSRRMRSMSKFHKREWLWNKEWEEMKEAVRIKREQLKQQTQEVNNETT